MFTDQIRLSQTASRSSVIILQRYTPFQIIIMNSDSEGEDAAPFLDASLVAGWQHPNAGASALQVRNLLSRRIIS